MVPFAVAGGVTPAGVTPGLRPLAWLIEARGLANRSEGLGWPGPVDKSEGFRWAGLAQGPSIKVRGWGAGLAQGLSIKVRGWGPGWPANRSEGFWGYGPRAGRPTLFGKPSLLWSMFPPCCIWMPSLC